MRNILITNDDGYKGRGLFPLIEALLPLGKVTVVVPDRNRSAGSHAITLDKPVRVDRIGSFGSKYKRYLLERIGGRFFAAKGTPADCVRLGCICIIKEKVDLVAAGINDGYNLGGDIIYSATVAAAREAAIEGIPSIAISKLVNSRESDFSVSQIIAYNVCKRMLNERIPKGVYFNMNIPDKLALNNPRIAAAKLGTIEYGRRYSALKKKNKCVCYTMFGEKKKSLGGAGSDVVLIGKNYVTVTPLPICSEMCGLDKKGKLWLKKIIAPF